jgi:small subunit ribosomal protein S16
MVVIRLSRGGSKNNPFYNVVVADSRNRRDGRFIERVGFYNPSAKIATESLRIDEARVSHWANHGAQLSDTVIRLVKTHAKGPEALIAARAKDATKAEANKAKIAAAMAAKMKAKADAEAAEAEAKAAADAAKAAEAAAVVEETSAEVEATEAPAEVVAEAEAPAEAPVEEAVAEEVLAEAEVTAEAPAEDA